MGFLVVFLAGVGAIAAWWLSQQRLASKPWLEEGAVDAFPADHETWPTAGGIGPGKFGARKVGLGVFLAVASSLFALLFSAYAMQMHGHGVAAGASMPPLPRVLWVNTLVLIFSDAALHVARNAAARRDTARLRAALLAAIVFALLFLFGQLLAWRQFAAAGYFAAASQASAMFYLLTMIHGLHVAGGLAVLARTGARALIQYDARAQAAIIDLCAIYWRFLLLVWIVMFGVFMLV